MMPGKIIPCFLALSASLVLFAGCKTPEQQACYPPPPAPCNRCGTNTPPPQFMPAPAGAPANYYTPPTFSPPTNTPPSYTPPPNQGAYAPPTVRLAPPEAAAQEQPRPDSSRDTTRITPQPKVEPPPASIPSGQAPLAKNDTQASPRLPAEIAYFAMVKPRVASGQQPAVDGPNWLQNAGYRTVLNVREPADHSTSAKLIFETRGLRYISLEVGPENLTKDVVEQFNKVVTNEANQPLFVYDRDSSLAGALWYVHFRTVGSMSDEKARGEAERLGFRSDRDENSRKMWSAVQAYLRNTNP
jgi:protein tyrosine phosphatase (PTP) superfamily phosphohydrolase (DUF442 family)